MKPDSSYAVLTGDISKSSRLSAEQLEAVRQSIRDAVGAIRSWKRGLVTGQLAFFRGDSWQVLLSDPAFALRAAVLIRAMVIAGGLADTRVAVGIGPVDNLDANNITQSTGQAFSLSGSALDAMKEPSRLVLSVADSPGKPAGLVAVIGQLCDALINEWTPRQAEIVSHAIDPAEPIQEVIAQSVDPSVSRQQVSKALIGANWTAVHQAIAEWENAT